MHPNAPSVSKRLEAFKALLDEVGIDPEGTSYSGEEDAALTLDGDPDYPLDQFASVTYSGEYVYVKLFPTFEGATRYAVENVADNLYAESPGEVRNLDDGGRFLPVWEELPWKRVN